jgi:hypothetical protein
MVIKALLRGLLTIDERNLLFFHVKGTLRRASHALDMPIGPDCYGIQPTRSGEEPNKLDFITSIGINSSRSYSPHIGQQDRELFPFALESFDLQS